MGEDLYGLICSMRFFVLGLTLSVLEGLGQGTGPTNPYVEGRVVDAATGSAVREAVVTISYEAPPKAGVSLNSGNHLGQSATTGDDGSFRMIAPVDVPFHLQVDGHGFVSTGTFMGRAPDAERIRLKAGEAKTGLVLKLVREASLGGRIVDRETGEGVAGLPVHALLRTKQRGRSN